MADDDYNGVLSPRMLGVLSAAFRGLQASGPSRTPMSVGQIVGDAGLAGLNAYSAGVQNQRQGVLLEAQMDEIKRKRSQQQRIEAFAQSLPEDKRAAFLVDPAAYIKNQNENPYGKVNPADFTPESILAFNTTRDFSRLVPVRKHEAVTTAGANGEPVTSFVNPYQPPAALPQPIKREMVNTGDAVVSVNPYQPPQRLQTTPQGFTRDARGNLKIDPGFLSGRSQIAAAGATRLNVDTRQESEFGKKLGGELGDMYSGLLRADFNAPANIGKYQRLGSLLSQVNTGKFMGGIQDLKAAAKSMGFDLTAMGVGDDVAPAQAARSLSNQMALELRNPAGGAGMPGAMSDQDREFLRSMVPSIENDAAAIPLMIDYRIRLAKREQDVAKQARAYRKKHGRFDEGFFDQLAEWADKTPLFPEATQRKPPAPPTSSGPGWGIRKIP